MLQHGGIVHHTHSLRHIHACAHPYPTAAPTPAPKTHTPRLVLIRFRGSQLLASAHYWGSGGVRGVEGPGKDQVKLKVQVKTWQVKTLQSLDLGKDFVKSREGKVMSSLPSLDFTSP